jgi:hypothetical protein
MGSSAGGVHLEPDDVLMLINTIGESIRTARHGNGGEDPVGQQKAIRGPRVIHANDVARLINPLGLDGRRTDRTINGGEDPLREQKAIPRWASL